MTAPRVEDLAAALRDPAAYPHRPERVEVVETHTSWVFLAGERAYKLKKAVDLGFLDFTTFERRLEACEAEVRLNEALAPGVYLGVVPVNLGPAGVRIGGAGERVEVVVEMRRLPAERMLDRLLDAGQVDNALVEALAALLVRFHAEAATGPGVDEHGSPEAVAFNVRENFLQTEPAIGSALSARLHRFLRGRAEAFLARERPLLERRVAEGRIRDGHGDLHAGNVCVEGSGRILAYDRIEFAARFRCGDVAADLAFLAMDLDARGYRGFSGYLARRYAQLARDPELERLLPFYKEYRAVVRAKVATIEAADESRPAEARAARRRAAMRLFALAASYELAPVLVLTCGLPASGKTTAARAVAAPFEAVILRSDVRRKQLAGLAPGARAAAAFSEGIYAPELTEQTYAALLADAREALREGRSVVVDASFPSAARRAPFAALAGRLGVPFAVAEVAVPDDVAVARLAARRAAGSDASDADLEIRRRMAELFEPPVELPGSRVAIDGTAGPEEAAAAVLEVLVPEIGESP